MQNGRKKVIVIIAIIYNTSYINCIYSIEFNKNILKPCRSIIEKKSCYKEKCETGRNGLSLWEPFGSLSRARSPIAGASAEALQRYCEIERISLSLSFLCLSFSFRGSTFSDFPWEQNSFRCVGRALVRHNKMHVSDIRLSPLRGPLCRSDRPDRSVYRIGIQTSS